MSTPVKFAVQIIINAVAYVSAAYLAHRLGGWSVGEAGILAITGITANAAGYFAGWRDWR